MFAMTATTNDAAPDFSAARVLVVGDVMLDRYWSGPAERISPEAPVPIIRVEGLEERCGGAANVAVNAARLGASVCLIGAVGDDDQGRTLGRLLEGHGVRCRLVGDDAVGTIVKLRLMSQHHQLMRLDFESAVTRTQADGIARAFAEEIAGHDIVVFSDYGKGSLTGVDGLIERARKAGRQTLVDPWGKDFSRYRNAGVITPNGREFAIAAGESADEAELEARARAMTDALALRAVLVTRGERGMSLFEAGRAAVHIPSAAREVFDVTGAGDTVIAALAAGLGCGRTLEDAARLANRAAGLVVARLGTASVTAGELGHQRIVSADGLARAVRAAQAQGQKVVMTNGCFDIIHAGHVSYLNRAASLGDRLAVAVNGDASVARLKGPGRPINRLENRLAVLAALRSVDWVAPFDGTPMGKGYDDTPAEIIGAVKPDILVKGADWRADEIVGADTVLANGGTVRTIPFVDGLSTTGIVEQIRKSDK